MGLPLFPLPLAGCGGSFFDSRDACGGSAKGPDFLDRADADAVGLAQGAIDGPSFRHAHLGAVDKERDIGRIGIAVADEAESASDVILR